MHMYTVLLIMKIGVLRERSENCAKPAIAVFLNSLTLRTQLKSMIDSCVPNRLAIVNYTYSICIYV